MVLSMFHRIGKSCAGRAVAVFAGLHSMPPETYALDAPADTVRIFLDQWGDHYPRDAQTRLPVPPRLGGNVGFSIRAYMAGQGYPITEDDMRKLQSSVVEDLRRKMERIGSSRLVVLVHGYNNSYTAALHNFRLIRERIEHHDATPKTYLEVFWDGLFRGPFTFPAPLLYWFDGMTYSNLAGQIGLRSVVNGLPRGSELLVVTHSRGAGVAVSCFVDPKYDAAIHVPPFQTAKASHLGGVALVCLAPAIGSGHDLHLLPKALPALSGLFVGFNSLDPALQKSVAKPYYFGDTSLGTDERHFTALASQLNQDRPWIQRVVYQNYRQHKLDGYLNHAAGQHFDDLLWAAGWKQECRDGCQLVRLKR